MPEAPHCPRCDEPILPDAGPEGLCPRCLMGALLDEASDVALSQPDTRLLADETPGGEDRDVLDWLVGSVLDEKYRIEKKLGQGGMGAVYLSTHLGTGRLVAVKVVDTDLMRHPEFVERFKREARAAGRLRHPNIVNVTDFGFAEACGQPLAYLVMEYLDGMTLADAIDRSELSSEQAITILEQLCLAVDEAHRNGVVHRDLKPGNIWLEPDRRGGHTVKVLDFGLAQLDRTGFDDLAVALPGAVVDTRIDPEAATLALPTVLDRKGAVVEPANATAEMLTRAGAIMGTPCYMSPEQRRGERVDARSDIFSIGVIAFQMLTGEITIDGKTFAERPVHEIPEGVFDPIPDELKLPVKAALAWSAAQRPAAAGALAEAFRASGDDDDVTMRQAVSLVWNNLPVLLALSALSGPLPWVLAACIGLMFLDPYSALYAGNAGVLPAQAPLVLVAFVFALRFGGQLVRASAFVRIVARLVEGPHRLRFLSVRPSMSARGVRTNLRWHLRQWPLYALVAVTFLSLPGTLEQRKTALIAVAGVLFLYSLFAIKFEWIDLVGRMEYLGTVILLEGFDGGPARARAAALSDRTTDPERMSRRMSASMVARDDARARMTWFARLKANFTGWVQLALIVLMVGLPQLGWEIAASYVTWILVAYTVVFAVVVAPRLVGSLAMKPFQLPAVWVAVAALAGYQVLKELGEGQADPGWVAVGVVCAVLSLLAALVLNAVRCSTYALDYLRARRIGGESIDPEAVPGRRA